MFSEPKDDSKIVFLVMKYLSKKNSKRNTNEEKKSKSLETIENNYTQETIDNQE